MTDLIHQIYCTHCTYGTSALERREGELAGRPLGYSARASSLEMNELRKQYRLLERFLYYYLPSDSPSEDRLRLEADTAPRRLVASLSLSGLQMLAQISYRQFDTAGRAGSYFAHVLVSPRGQQPWPVTQCLQLWGAPWVDTDSADLPFELSPLVELSDLLGGQRPAIDDAVLLSFLTAEPGDAFDDPRDVIPQRWRDTPAEQRRALLAESMQGFIRLGSSSRDSVVTVVEPSVAALVYYGIARLLPAGDVQSTLGFSTFEPAPERALVPLAATTFREPGITDLRPELYRGRGSVRNTFLDKRGGAEHATGPYVELLLDTLLRQGWPAVDQLLAGFGEAGVKRLEELDLLGRAHSAAPAIFLPAAAFDGTIGQQSPIAAGYFASQVRRELASRDADQLRALIGSPHQVAILELVATSVDAIATQPNVQFLLSTLSGDQLAHWLASKTVGPACKIAALASIINKLGKLPEACAFVWKDESSAADPKAGGSAPIMTAVLSQLEQPVLERLYAHLTEAERPFFVRHLIRACEADPPKFSLLRRILNELPEARFFAALNEQGAALRRIYPAHDAELGARLDAMLTELPNQPREFSARLDLLQAWHSWLPDQFLGKRQLQLWQQFRSALLAIGEARNAPPAGILQKLTGNERRPSLDDLTHKAAVALDNALPAPFQQAAGFAAAQQRVLQTLGASLLNDTEFIPSGLLSKATWYFENHHWPQPVRTSGSRSRLPIPLIAAAAVVVVCGVVGFGYYLSQPASDKQLANSRVSKRAGANPVALPVSVPPKPPATPPLVVVNKKHDPAAARRAANKRAISRWIARIAHRASRVAPLLYARSRAGDAMEWLATLPQTAQQIAQRLPPAPSGQAKVQPPAAGDTGVATRDQKGGGGALPMPSESDNSRSPMNAAPVQAAATAAQPGANLGAASVPGAPPPGGPPAVSAAAKEVAIVVPPSNTDRTKRNPSAKGTTERREVSKWIDLRDYLASSTKSGIFEIANLWQPANKPTGEIVLHPPTVSGLVGAPDKRNPKMLLLKTSDSKTAAEIWAAPKHLAIKPKRSVQSEEAPFGRAVLEIEDEARPMYLALYPQLFLRTLEVRRIEDDGKTPPACQADIPDAPEVADAKAAIAQSTFYIASGKLFVAEDNKWYEFKGKDAKDGRHAIRETVEISDASLVKSLEVVCLRIGFDCDRLTFIIRPQLRTVDADNYAEGFLSDPEIKESDSEISSLEKLIESSTMGNINAIRNLASKLVPPDATPEWARQNAEFIQKKVIGPAKGQLERLRKKRKARVLELGSAAYRETVAAKLGRIQRLSVKLYREVDGIRAEDIWIDR